MIKKNNDYPPSTHGKALGLKPIDRFRERILKVSLVFLPLYFFNPLSKQLYISPLEYLMVVIFIIFLFSLSYRPKFHFFGHRSIWLFFLSGLLTTISLTAVLLTNFNIDWIKAWGGRWIFRYILIFVVVAALSINKKHLNMLIRIITYTNFIVAALAILLVIISKDISAFRKAFSSAPPVS